MKLLKLLRYPILFLTVILIPTSLATIFLDFPRQLENAGWIENQERWAFISSIVGYLLGYLLVHSFTTTVNATAKSEVYPKRIRTTYLFTNAVIALLLLGMLGYATSLMFDGPLLNPTVAVLFIGFPWLSVQMLLLLFFVRSESLYE